MTDARAVAERYDEALGRNDADGCAATVRADTKIEVPGAMLQGPEQLKGWMQPFFDAFPDISHSHTPFEIDGNVVRTNLTVKGTNTEPFESPGFGFPATGKTMDLLARNELTIEGDHISALTISFDMNVFMKQLGLA
jgi:predicted ester cyclase